MNRSEILGVIVSRIFIQMVDAQLVRLDLFLAAETFPRTWTIGLEEDLPLLISISLRHVFLTLSRPLDLCQRIIEPGRRESALPVFSLMPGNRVVTSLKLARPQR
jgi:hypothetical protein